MAMIEVSNVTLEREGRKVLENFTCAIERGKITALIGRNGIGKSSLLAALAGEKLLISGEISLDGRNISTFTPKELARIRSFAQQHHGYWMPYSTREILTLGHQATSSERTSEIIAAFDLESFIDQSVTTLSGGQIQRVELARAFMREVPLVLLDEPFASQDLNSIESLKTLFQRESSQGRTIVIVAHAPVQELQWCNAVVDLAAR